MRMPATYSTDGRAIGPYPDPLHGQEVEEHIRRADLCEGAIPAYPEDSACAMVVAIEDHLSKGQLLYAIQHQHELDMLAGSLHRLSYAAPDAYWGMATHLPDAGDALEDVLYLADQGQLAIEQWLRQRGLDGM
jgi:hypothetical protein